MSNEAPYKTTVGSLVVVALGNDQSMKGNEKRFRMIGEIIQEEPMLIKMADVDTDFAIIKEKDYYINPKVTQAIQGSEQQQRRAIEEHLLNNNRPLVSALKMFGSRKGEFVKVERIPKRASVEA